MASDDPEEIRRLGEGSPKQGLSRFHLHYDVIEVMQEDRLLRAIIVLHVESGLGRQTTPAEAAALHAVVDVMFQRSVIALVEDKEAQLRAATERELKYLSFLSHDLNNHLAAVSINLQMLRRQFAKHADFAAAEKMAGDAEQGVRTTIDGMRRLLEHERLRKGGATSAARPVNLHEFAADMLARFARQANEKKLTLVNEVRADVTIDTDAELISLVFQNLVGNAIKFSRQGTVRLASGCCDDARTEAGSLSVVDEGPGIAPEKAKRIFEAF